MKMKEISNRRRRKKLEKRAFFEGIYFENPQAKDAITDWVFELQYSKCIRINKFVDLISVWSEIELPIKIVKDTVNSRFMRIIVVDYEGREFFVEMQRYYDVFEDAVTYILRRKCRENRVSRMHVYAIENSKIVLKECSDLLVDGAENVQKVATIEHEDNSEIALVTVKDEDGKNKIIIKYTVQDVDDDEVMDFLLSIDLKNCYNVISVFIGLIEILGQESVTSIQGYVNGYNYSEILVEAGLVKRYTYSKYQFFGDKYIMSIIHPCMLCDEFVKQYKYRV